MELVEHLHDLENPLMDVEEDKEDEDFLHVAFEIIFPRRLRIIHKRSDHFATWREPEFSQRFRFRKATVKYIISLIENKIKSPTTRDITLIRSLLCHNALK